MKCPENWPAADCDLWPSGFNSKPHRGKSVDPNNFANAPPVFISVWYKKMYIAPILDEIVCVCLSGSLDGLVHNRTPEGAQTGILIFTMEI